MVNSQTFLALVSVAVGCYAAAAFTAQRPMTNKIGNVGTNPDLLVMSLSPVEEQQAAAMSEYLVKAHEEKLKAVQAIEEKKQAEIDALQSQLAELKGQQQSAPSGSALATTPSGGENLADLSKEQLVNKLLSYQEFMSKYIVESQEQKVNAVKAAEAATAKKYEEKMLLLGESKAPVAEKAAPAPVAAAPVTAAPVSKENEIYLKRNAQVSAAAAAGKSRWGDKEVEKAQNSATLAKPAEPAKPAAAAAEVKKAPPAAAPISPEVAAADKGLRSDGSVGGPTLAERVAQGANAMAASSEAASPVLAATPSPNQILFQQRNAKVAAAGKAGKSRWGTMEVEKATEQAGKALVGATESPTVEVIDIPPEVAAADKGLSSAGAVGGPSLAQRVNLGAALLS